MRGVLVTPTPQRADAEAILPYVQSNGIQLSYEVSGSGANVLLIMGSGASARVWEMYQTPALNAAGYRTCAFDNRGIAPSEIPPGKYSLDDMVADTAGLIQALDLAPCHVVGVSLGALIAQELAVYQPQLVRSAVLAATKARSDRARRAQDAANRALRESGVELPRAYRAVKTAFDMLSPVTVDDDGAVAEWLDLFEYSGDGTATSGQGWIDTGRDRRTELARVTVPCRVITFTDDRISPPHLGAEVAEAIPDCDLVELGDCGHLGYLERPEPFNQAVIEFLDKHSSLG
ncbi:alpha/beta fold hydrolase [Streptomyces viridochromogenes]|nr:alpha/beta hydrolase [Streptomyces viridochromogenes]